jgi:aerobic-type carbon monoxide dehydrogenase small subunit (CoxS/CutS family)
MKKGTRGTRGTDGPDVTAVREVIRSGERTERRRTGQLARRRDDGRARVTLHVNGEPLDVTFDDYKTLLEVLREDLALTGTKHGCELGECGACAVLLDGQPVLSCLVLAVACDRRRVTTIEGIADGPELSVIQAKMADLGGAQCGYCTPGIVLTAKHLLDENPNPTRGKIADALSGNLCRCTGYLQIFEAVEAAAAELRTTGDRIPETGDRS